MRLTHPLRAALVTAAAAVTAVVAPAGAAGAQDGTVPPPPPPECEATTFNSCAGGQDVELADEAFIAGSGAGVQVNLLFERYFDEVRVSEDSAAGYETGCWGIRLAADGVELAEAVADRDGLGENDVAWGNCDPDETIDREFIARLYWERLAAPPPPTPLRVRPGEARVGVPAYLEIGGPNPASQAFDTPIGRLTFAMTPRYVVTWGDGASSTTASQGAPPGGGPGAIIHTYTDHGAVTITVAAHWRATWTLGPFSGDLPELIAPTAASLDLQVEQRQATVD